MPQEPPEPEEGQPPQRPPIVRLALLFYGGLFAVALLWGLIAGRSLLFASPEAGRLGVAPLRDTGVGLLAGALVIAVSHAVTRRTAWGDRLGRILATVLGPLTLTECVVLALVSGVAEEVFFRGAVQPHVGLLAASALFALAHFAPRRELLPWTAFSFLAGLVLGALFETTGNLLAPVLAHALVNGVNLRWLTLRYG